jgi:futalosine hydrolase
MAPIALICSVQLEAEPLLASVEGAERLTVGRRLAYRGTLGGTDVLVVIGGMAKVNAAHALTALLERFHVSGVLGFGVGGAYPGSHLRVGDIALASSQHYGDEGVATPDGWMTCEGIGIPLLERDGTRYFNDLPVDRQALGSVAAALGSVALGPFVTVSCCSGTRAAGLRLRDRFDAICETMEGAAYAHVAAMYGVRYIELRGISNLVEDRDLSRWRLQDAASAAAAALPIAVAAWRPHESYDVAPRG